MKQLLSIIFLLFCLSLPLIAQTPQPSDCPSLSVFGPPGIVNPGDSGTYNAEVDAKGKQLDLEYVWSVSAGKILNGQGTVTIQVEQPRTEQLTVTITVKGFPEGCSNTASEVYFVDPAPEPVKIAHFDTLLQESDSQQLKEIIDELRSHPNNQIYIFLDYTPGTAKEIMERQERKLFLALTNAGIDGSRIMFQRFMDGPNVVQFWRVPPGAENPICDECEKQTCPTILVTGPAGITRPGETATFAANVDVDDLKKLSYKWSVSSETIESGQGSPSITVRVSKELVVRTLIATVKVEGLPDTCTNVALEVAPVAFDFHPIVADEYGKLPVRNELGRLDVIAQELNQRENMVGFFMISLAKRESYSGASRRVARIRTHLNQVRKISSERVLFAFREGESSVTRIYLLPRDFVSDFGTSYGGVANLENLRPRFKK